MHYRWLKWQKSAGEEAKTNYQIQSLRLQRRNAYMECLIHNHYLSQQEAIVAGIRSNLYKSQHKYEEIDMELALIDGRFSVVKPSDVKNREDKNKDKKQKESIKRTIGKMSETDIEKLKRELLEML